MCKKILKLELFGVLIIFLLGFIWHELYDYSNRNAIIALIAPINESYWEHWKIGFYPIIIYAVIEYFLIIRRTKSKPNNFIFAKFISILVFDFVCFGLISLVHMLTGSESFITHIVSYFLGILCAQLVSYYIICNTRENPKLWYIAVFALFFQIIIFILFTYNPPELPYFQDTSIAQCKIFSYFWNVPYIILT